MRCRATVPFVAVVALALVLGGVQLTLARFVDSAAVTGSLSSARLEPPTDLVGTGGATVILDWTPTTTTWATGYDVFRSATSGGGYSNVGSVTPSSAATAVDAPGTGTWYYVLRSVFHNWRSARSNETTVVVAAASVTTPPAVCTGNAPVTAGAGHNDGYETAAAQGCAPDGVVAVDASTGTDMADSCTSTTKDRHDFWGYAFGLPPAVGAIEGITVRPTAGMNNNGGVTRICVQLSWDGGSTWTATRSTELPDQDMATYTIGGAAETWGRAWTLPELGPDRFRLRVVDTSTQPRKDVRLDAIEVAISYAP